MSADLSFLSGGGEMGARMRAHDWTSTSLGPPGTWPQSLRTALSICLNSPILGTVLWGPDLVMLYNDTYIPSMADRHPSALGRPVGDVWGEAWDQVSPPFLNAMESGEGFVQEGIVVPMQRNGRQETTYWDISASPIRGEDGSIVGLFNQGTEITTRVLADRERDRTATGLRDLNQTLVRQNEERAAQLRLFENIVQSATAPICAFDTEFRLIAFNEAHNDEFFRVQGFRTKIGDVFPDLFVPEQRPVMRALMARALTGEAFTVTEEFGNPEIGQPCWVLTYSPLRDEGGRVVGAFHYAQDISGRLLAEAELSKLQDALRQAQKMEAVGQLTGGLAHDFNNLLAGISGSLEFMQARLAQGRIAEIEKYLVGAQGAAKRAAALTHRLLAFSRRQTLDPKPTDVNRLVQGMEELLARTVGPSIRVETVASGGLWPTLVDPNQLENALLNLCINGRDAMPDGGTLTIETANRWLDDRAARERDLPPGQYVSMCVSDNGTGMPPDVVERAFDPFFTTKPLGVGTGLGLSMIYGFARQSGGQVRIYSEVGKGTMVCVYLPRHHGEASAEEHVTGPANLPKAETAETVLVIDDEPLVRMLVVDVLEDLGYTALEAGDGPQGMAILRTDVHLDLLITDVGLPNGMNGRQVAEAARALRPDLKVLFVTGYAENAVLSHGHLDPGMQVVTKPFDMGRLAERIRSMVGSKA